MKNQKKATTDSDLQLFLFVTSVNIKHVFVWDSCIQFLVCGSSEECVIETLHRDVATSSGKQSQLHPLAFITGSESTGAYKKKWTRYQ
jgi:hypothetical protein